MARATNSPASRKRRKKVLKYAKGYFGNKSKLFRYAKEAVQHAWQYAYIDRKKKKANMRGLWIVRLNAVELGRDVASKQHGGLNAKRQTDREQYQHFAHDEPDDEAGLCSYRKADAQLFLATCDNEGHHTVEADRREHGGE